jgi:hypothetical protein
MLDSGNQVFLFLPVENLFYPLNQTKAKSEEAAYKRAYL